MNVQMICTCLNCSYARLPVRGMLLFQITHEIHCFRSDDMNDKSLILCVPVDTTGYVCVYVCVACVFVCEAHVCVCV